MGAMYKTVQYSGIHTQQQVTLLKHTPEQQKRSVCHLYHFMYYVFAMYACCCSNKAYHSSMEYAIR